jgi:hypothetical protein
MANYVSRASSCAPTGLTTPKPCCTINPNLELAHAHNATNEIKNDNSHPRLPQCVITSEGGHT